MKMWKKLLKGALVLPLFFICVQRMALAASAEEDFSGKCGLVKGELIRDDSLQYEVSALNSLVTEEDAAYWTKYADDYYYDQLPEVQKKTWDDLEVKCIEAAVGTDTVDMVMVKTQGMRVGDKDAVKNFLEMFKYSNPQYYFLSNRYVYASSAEGLIVAVGIRVYDGFQDGETRSDCTEKFCMKVDKWVDDVNKGQKDEDRVKLAHDIIAANTIYDNESLYNQSAYSTVCEEKTVCAGYAAALQLLLNPNGVQTVEVTSTDHGWNIVKTHGHWYVVDVTWDDQSQIIYSYYMKSDATVQFDNTHHAPEEMWEGLLPDLKYDSTLSEWEYYSPYFTKDRFDYFKVNDNSDLGDLCVEVLNNADATAPKSVMYDENEYKVLNAVDKPEETDKPNTPTMPTEGKFASNGGFDFFEDAQGNVTCYGGGEPVIDEFKCDGIYTYYFQADGTAMRDHLTYHPDGVHVIYFDEEGHEVFDSFALVGYNIPSMETGSAVELNEYCYFNTFGYQYVDMVTYDVKGEKLYYANTSGVLEHRGWFTFSDTITYAGDGKPWSATGQRGYANDDCTLMKDTLTYDKNGNLCYMQGNGAATYDF